MLDPSGRNLGAGRRFGKRPGFSSVQTKARAFLPGLRTHYLQAPTPGVRPPC